MCRLNQGLRRLHEYFELSLVTGPLQFHAMLVGLDGVLRQRPRVGILFLLALPLRLLCHLRRRCP